MSRHADDLVVPVLIAGAGPTGVVSATMLARRGIGSLVVDRYADVYPLPRAVHLDDEIYRVLQSIGVAEEFSAITEPRLGLRIVDWGMRVIAQFDRTRRVGDHGWPQANFFDQPELERVLRANLARYPDARLRGRCELVELEQGVADGPAPVRAVLRDLDTDERSTVWAHAVLGCDGANSTVRALIGATLLDLGFEERWVVVDVRSPQELDVWDGAYQVADSHRAGTFMRVLPGRYRWEFQLVGDERPEDLLAPERLAGLVRPWTQDVPFDSLEVVRSAEYTFKARIADRWQDRRVFLLGDAAHLTPPFIGQGLCAAMRDAANLTWKLASVLQGVAPESLLATYQAERQRPAKALIAKAKMVGTVMSGGNGATAPVRKRALSLVSRIPGIGVKVLDAPPPPLPAGPLVVRPRGTSLPGTLVPQPWVLVDGRRVRLDAVLGDGYAVLTTRSPEPSVRAAAARLGAPVVLVTAVPVAAAAVAGIDLSACDEDGVLLSWLASARATAVVVRPDRVVLAQTRPGQRELDPGFLGPEAVPVPAGRQREAVGATRAG
ncbi:MAG: bifunctional 3-(3-hydroxy-phenyl)propionate/3-hydroxycinnamic acid hydroxylase [Candidatus Nanopelagicales bacterium]